MILVKCVSCKRVLVLADECSGEDVVLFLLTGLTQSGRHTNGPVNANIYKVLNNATIVK